MDATDDRRRRAPRLLVVTDGRGDAQRLRTTTRALAAVGADHVWLWLREPLLEAAALQDRVRMVGELAPDTRIVLSDRIDVALAAGCAGVQLGERDLPIERVRAWAGARLRLGRSVHDAAGAAGAIRGGADWLVFGHVLATPSKAGRTPRGLAALGAVAALGRAAGVPVLAIGGVTAHDVPRILAAGADGVAVMRAVSDAPDAREALQELADAVAAATRD